MDCKHCRTAFLQAHHRLHHQKIHTCIRKDRSLLLIHFHQLVKHQISEREQLPARHCHITGNKCLAIHRLL